MLLMTSTIDDENTPTPKNRLLNSDLTDILTIFHRILYNEDSTRKITSEFIYDSKLCAKIFNSSEVVSQFAISSPLAMFKTVTHAAWIIQDLLMYDLSKIIGIKMDNIVSIGESPRNIIGLFKGLSNEMDKSINSVANIVKKITPLTTTKINNLSKFISLNNVPQLTNIFSESFNVAIGKTIEQRLYRLIKSTNPEYAWVKKLGYKLIKEVSVSFGEEIIETHNSKLLDLINKSYGDKNHERGTNINIGNVKNMYAIGSHKRSINKLYIPLQFFHCKNPGFAIPLICLLHTNVTLSVTLNDIASVLYIEPDSFFIKKPQIKCKFLIQYVYLENDERMRMANAKHEYLIERFQYNGELSVPLKKKLVASNVESDVKYELSPYQDLNIQLSDPIKYLFWHVVICDNTTKLSQDIINWDKSGFTARLDDGTEIRIGQLFKGITIYMNENIREGTKPENYYTYVVPYSRKMGSFDVGEYVYSMALYPLLHQPSGATNFSELSTAHIRLEFSDEFINLLNNELASHDIDMKMELWGCGYNNLRVLSGMAGLSFFK